MKKRKIIIKNHQSPGDGIALLYAITCIKKTFFTEFDIGVRVTYPEIFESNPLLTNVNEKDAQIIEMQYPEINQSNNTNVSFMNGVLHYLEDMLKIKVKKQNVHGFLHIADIEKSWYSAVYEHLKKDVPYWVIDAGYKNDYTNKFWGTENYQKIVDMLPNIWFVQVGHATHIHPELKGPNVINLVGKTDLRQMIRLIYNSFGVVTPVSFPMIAAAAIPAHPRFGRIIRPCMVISGGREPNHYQQLPGHNFFHTIGQMPCCGGGGCWLSRTVALNDNDEKDKKLCANPVKISLDQTIPKCMSIITPEEVVQTMKRIV